MFYYKVRPKRSNLLVKKALNMPTYIRNFYPGVYCHIFNHGIEDQEIFKDDDDYLLYLKKIREIKQKCNISLICYCLMPNHFHLLARQNSDISISKFMQSLNTSYSMLFNKKHNRKGHLFQGTFQQKNVENEQYLSQLSSYIHLNPVTKTFSGKLENYKWSSYPDYIKKRNGTLCDKEVILADQSIKSYKKSIEEEMAEKIKIKRLDLKGLTF